MAEVLGGCLCGAVRYQIDAKPSTSYICHCDNCRRATGGPAVAWLDFPTEALDYTKGSPRHHRVESDGNRGVRVWSFCGDCGTTLTYEARDGAIDVTAGSLDDPEMFPPGNQGSVEERLSWANIGPAAEPGLYARIFWSAEGFPKDAAFATGMALRERGVFFDMEEHPAAGLVDAIFIGPFVPATLARYALSVVPYQISCLYRPDFNSEYDPEGTGTMLGVGVRSQDCADAIPVSPEDLRGLSEDNLSNVGFHKRLRDLTEAIGPAR